MSETTSLTTAEISARIGRSVAWTAALLEDEVQRGLIERDGNRWRLTADAERRYGRILRRVTRET